MFNKGSLALAFGMATLIAGCSHSSGTRNIASVQCNSNDENCRRERREQRFRERGDNGGDSGDRGDNDRNGDGRGRGDNGRNGRDRDGRDRGDSDRNGRDRDGRDRDGNGGWNGPRGPQRLALFFSVTHLTDFQADQAAGKACSGRFQEVDGKDTIKFGDGWRGELRNYKCVMNENDRDRINDIPVLITHRSEDRALDVAYDVCESAGRRARLVESNIEPISFGKKMGVMLTAKCRVGEWSPYVPMVITHNSLQQAEEWANRNCRAMQGQFRRYGSDDVDFGPRNGIAVYGVCDTGNR